MIAPRAAARPRGQDDATSRASQTGAHEAHSGPEEHAPLAPTPGFRGLTLPPSFERSSATSSPLRAREHAGSHARQDGAAEPGLARVHGADPRKAAVRLRGYGAFEALEVPENARCAGREPPLFSLSGGRRAPSWSTPTMPAHGVGTPAWASACLQPAEGGEGSVFRGAARPPQGAPSDRSLGASVYRPSPLVGDERKMALGQLNRPRTVPLTARSTKNSNINVLRASIGLALSAMSGG
jgi:hypothetical protein